MHPAQEELLLWLTPNPSLPEPQRKIPGSFLMLAEAMTATLGNTAHGAELTAGLRKLLEAKDCMVRASLP